MRSNIDLARDMLNAYANEDRSAAERLVAEEFRFTSPLDNSLDRTSYFEICWPNSTDIVGFEVRHAVADGDRVFITYEGVTSSGKRFRNTEIMTMRSGRIVAVEVYFGWNIPHDVPDGQHRDP